MVNDIYPFLCTLLAQPNHILILSGVCDSYVIRMWLGGFCLYYSQLDTFLSLNQQTDWFPCNYTISHIYASMFAFCLLIHFIIYLHLQTTAYAVTLREHKPASPFQTYCPVFRGFPAISCRRCGVKSDVLFQVILTQPVWIFIYMGIVNQRIPCIGTKRKIILGI